MVADSPRGTAAFDAAEDVGPRLRGEYCGNVVDRSVLAVIRTRRVLPVPERFRGISRKHEKNITRFAQVCLNLP